MSDCMVLALDATSIARTVWGEQAPPRFALASGVVGSLQGEAPYLDPAIVAEVLRRLPPDRWQATKIPGVAVVRSEAGRAFLVWRLDGGGVVLGFPAEIGLALNAEASVQVMEPTAPGAGLEIH